MSVRRLRLSPRLVLGLAILLVADATGALGALAARRDNGPDELAARILSESHRPRSRRPPRTSADRMIFWTGCQQLLDLSDADLDRWKALGVDGFVCVFGHLEDMGGSQAFTADPAADLAAPEYGLQRGLRAARLVERAAARGMKMYLGFYLVNHFNRATPLREWFDDAGWSDVLRTVADAAGTARLLGFAGVAFDQELYPQSDGTLSATWDWDYPGNERPEAQVRSKAVQRGQAMMRTLVEAFPRLEIVAYLAQFPETWEEVVQQVVNGKEHVHRSNLNIDFWDGLSSIPGYGAIRLLNATFYKTTHISGISWDDGLQYHYNRLHAYLSRRLSNWSYASTRLFESPFSWVDAGRSRFEAARSPGYVAGQLTAFRRWGMGREFGNYAQGFGTFDYGPYQRALRGASTPAPVDREPPEVVFVSAHRAGRGTAELRGYTTDNLAIRAVRWRTDEGAEGMAEMTWRVRSRHYYSGWDWQMDWAVVDVPVRPGPNRVTVTAEDIKGLATSITVVVDA